MTASAQNSKFGYLTIGKQIWDTTPVSSSKEVARVDGDVMKTIETVKNSAIQNIYNNASASVAWNETIEWSINTEISAKDAVWFLYGALWSIISSDVSSLTDWSVYKHTIEGADCWLPAFSIEQKTGGCASGASDPAGQSQLVSRAFGAKINSVSINIEEDILTLGSEINASGAFDVAFLAKNESPEAAWTSITAMVYANKKITITSTSHGLAVNDLVNITAVTPTTFNWQYRVVEVTDANTFVVWKETDPWTYSSWGTVTKLSMFTFRQWQINGLVAWDTVRLYEKATDTYEEVDIVMVDTATDTLWFASVISTAFTVANDTKVELVPKAITYDRSRLFGFANAKVQFGDTIALAEVGEEYDLSTATLNIANNIETRFGTAFNTIKETGGDYTMEMTSVFRDVTVRDDYRKRERQAFVITLDNWEAISSTDANNNTYKIKIYIPSVQYDSREAPTASQGLIEESTALTWYHDFDLWYSIKIEIRNEKNNAYYTT